MPPAWSLANNNNKLTSIYQINKLNYSLAIFHIHSLLNKNDWGMYVTRIWLGEGCYGCVPVLFYCRWVTSCTNAIYEVVTFSPIGMNILVTLTFIYVKTYFWVLSYFLVINLPVSASISYHSLCQQWSGLVWSGVVWSSNTGPGTPSTPLSFSYLPSLSEGIYSFKWTFKDHFIPFQKDYIKCINLWECLPLEE